MEAVLFFLAAIGALGGAIGVVAMRNPFYAVLALIVHLFSLAVLFLLLTSAFVAAAQVVVYAGAVMVLYVFVVAYVGGGGESAWEPIPGQRFLAPLLGDRALRRALDRRPLLRPARRSAPTAPTSPPASATPPRSATCCSNSSCSPSRPPRSCCCSPRSARSSSPAARREAGRTAHEHRLVHRPLRPALRHRRGRHPRSAAARW